MLGKWENDQHDQARHTTVIDNLVAMKNLLDDDAEAPDELPLMQGKEGMNWDNLKMKMVCRITVVVIY